MIAGCKEPKGDAMDRRARAFMYFAFAFINFVFFHHPGLYALGGVFLVMGFLQLVALKRG